MTLPKLSQSAIAVAVAAVLSCGASAETTANGFLTDVEPYIAPLSASSYKFKHIYSVGEKVPLTGDTTKTKQFQLIGIPDGMGAYRTGTGKKTEIHLLVNHEISPWADATAVPPTLNPATQTEPIVGEALVKGAFVSKIILATDGSVKSANLAFTKVFQDEQAIGDISRVGNDTRPFSRFCSASLAGTAEGFDRNIFFTNEEDDTAAFSELGSQTVAIFDGEAHALSGLGHFAKENSVVQPRKDKRTVIMSMEDGPRTTDSQLYMYVGEKKKQKGATTLEKNGLVGGKLYALKITKAGQAKAGEAVDDKGGDVLEGTWVELEGASTKNATDLEIEADAKGAYGFVRVEDGSFHKTNPHVFYFVTTGDSQNNENKLGRIYQLTLDKKNPLNPCKLRLILNADEEVAKDPTVDVPISPDNIDNNGRYLMINEDGTSPSRTRMTQLGRDGSIWSMSLKDFSFAREGELDAPGRDGVTVQGGAGGSLKGGIWETTGIIDAGRFFARDAWFVGVQAHSPTTAPAANTVEDGQLLIMFDARF